MSLKTSSASNISEISQYRVFREGNPGDVIEAKTRDALHDHTVVTLSLHDYQSKAPYLSAGTEGRVIGSDNIDLIPSGGYVVHVYDSQIEARAAMNALTSARSCGWNQMHESGPHSDVLVGGEGVVIFRTHGVTRPDIAFEAMNGPVSFEIHDQRRLKDEMRPICLSFHFSLTDLTGLEGQNGRSRIDYHARARTLVDMAEEVVDNPTCMMFVQQGFESIPGALLPTGYISVEEVYERIDEICEETGFYVDHPSMNVLHQRLNDLRAGLTSAQPRDIIDGVARSYIDYALRKSQFRV